MWTNQKASQMNKKSTSLLAPIVVALALAAPTARAAHVEPDDQRLIDAAGCEEIVKQYGIHMAQEKAVAEEISRAKGDTAAANVAGAAALAVFGVGFFTWNDHSDAQENLAELRAYREAIGASGRKKGCALPG